MLLNHARVRVHKAAYHHPFLALAFCEVLQLVLTKVLAINVKFFQAIMTVIPKALVLFYCYCGKYTRCAILNVHVITKRNFVIRIGETLQKYICTNNDEALSGRHEDNY